jgi:starvation-inducible outer membrane lipoprotein
MDTRPRRIINQLLVVMLSLTLTACTTVPLGPETAAAPAACKTEEHP